MKNARFLLIPFAAAMLGIAEAQAASLTSEWIEGQFAWAALPYVELRACGYEEQALNVQNRVLEKIVMHPDFPSDKVDQLHRDWVKYAQRQDLLMGTGVYAENARLIPPHEQTQEDCSDALDRYSKYMQ